MWFRVGNAGGPVPALWLNAQNNYTNIQNLSVIGAAAFNNNISVGNNISSASVNVSVSYGAGSDMFFGMNGPGAGLLQFMTNWYFSFDRATGLLGYYLANGHYFQFRQDGQIQASLHGLSAGGGPWTAFSDARIKTVESDYTQGLEQVCTLQPVNYTYNGNDSEAPPSNHLDPMKAAEDKSVPSVPYPNSPHYKVAQDQTRFVGLIAQEVEAVFPEMVGQQSGHIDGVAVTDLRTMNTGPLIFALVNAVKELKARVEQLEAAAS